MKYIKTYENTIEQEPKGDLKDYFYYAGIKINRLQAFVNKVKKLKLNFAIFNLDYEAIIAIVIMTEDIKNNNFKRYPYFVKDFNTPAYIMSKYKKIPIEDIQEFIETWDIKKDAYKYNL